MVSYPLHIIKQTFFFFFVGSISLFLDHVIVIGYILPCLLKNHFMLKHLRQVKLGIQLWVKYVEWHAFLIVKCNNYDYHSENYLFGFFRHSLLESLFYIWSWMPKMLPTIVWARRTQWLKKPQFVLQFWN
jgi:hypothetical protein